MGPGPNQVQSNENSDGTKFRARKNGDSYAHTQTRTKFRAQQSDPRGRDRTEFRAFSNQVQSINSERRVQRSRVVSEVRCHSSASSDPAWQAYPDVGHVSLVPATGGGLAWCSGTVSHTGITVAIASLA